MAEISFECPNCKQHLDADEDMAGEAIECPSCNQQITIPTVRQTSTHVYNANREQILPSEPRLVSSAGPKRSLRRNAFFGIAIGIALLATTLTWAISKWRATHHDHNIHLSIQKDAPAPRGTNETINQLVRRLTDLQEQLLLMNYSTTQRQGAAIHEGVHSDGTTYIRNKQSAIDALTKYNEACSVDFCDNYIDTNGEKYGTAEGFVSWGYFIEPENEKITSGLKTDIATFNGGTIISKKSAEELVKGTSGVSIRCIGSYVDDAGKKILARGFVRWELGVDRISHRLLPSSVFELSDQYDTNMNTYVVSRDRAEKIVRRFPNWRVNWFDSSVSPICTNSGVALLGEAFACVIANTSSNTNENIIIYNRVYQKTMNDGTTCWLSTQEAQQIIMENSHFSVLALEPNKAWRWVKTEQ
jgi:DNA-directed RNA polymerase subunit RPC12/RpoP